ncbi:hypothetical protein PO878_12085 [Iamia majanohamensis]|uniref:Uncharacterized protein n=1 Tax=Iamia majanohamensis TaxID=467976 RepID=A0AAE9Y6H6_9ACTN|nr:hypothetical protein [Iamia majanohamensis]WCO65238.1 hypothetical protein PO878_12085 [Iamia majanohamensis]
MAPADPDLRRVAAAVARHPSLWPTGAAAAVRHLPEGWWRGPSTLRTAVPWLRFRLETAYGAERSTPTGADLVTWLRWARAWPRARG